MRPLTDAEITDLLCTPGAAVGNELLARIMTTLAEVPALRERAASVPREVPDDPGNVLGRGCA